MTTPLTATLSNLTACCWPTASLSRTEIADIGARSRVHGESPVLLTSCQRMEVYALDGCGCDAPIRFEGIEALRHLAEVAAGLHSLVLGESEILGQVRTALATAPDALGRPGDIAIAAARDLRRQTVFNSHSGHMLDRALSHSGVPPTGTALVIGAGAIGRLIAVRARELGFDRVMVAARSLPEAEWFTKGRFEFVPLAKLTAAPMPDVAIGCLGSSADDLDPARDLPPVRRLLVDLGTPRNFRITAGVPTIAIADMLNAAEERPHAVSRRASLCAQLWPLLERRLAMASDTMQSPVGLMRASVEAARAAEMANIQRLHPEIAPATLETISRSLVNRILHVPSQRLRAMQDDALAHELAALFASDEPGREE